MRPRRVLAACFIAFHCRRSGAFHHSSVLGPRISSRIARRGRSACSLGLKMASTTDAGASLKTSGLRSFVNGKEDGPTIVFVHGWPDDHKLWDKQVDHLKDRFRCVTTDLPGFGGDDANADRWGYSVDECVRRLERTVEAEGNGKPIFLVTHDWGCMFAFMLEAKRPELVQKMVAIDVGGVIKPGPLEFLVICSYQLWLAVAFLLGGPVGDFMAKSFAWLAGAPAWNRVARGAVCYPYYHWWDKVYRGEKVKGMMPQCPLLFLYGCTGAKKILTFHDKWWAEKVDKKEGSSAVAMTSSSHWVMRDQPDDLSHRIDEFLTDS